MPSLAQSQDSMVDLIKLKMDFVLALFLKLSQVNALFEQDFEVVFLVELKNADSKEVRIYVNSKNSICKQILEPLLFLNN